MADSIGRAMKEGRREDAEAAKASVAVLKEEQKGYSRRTCPHRRGYYCRTSQYTQYSLRGVPEGKTAADNVVEATGGHMPDLGSRRASALGSGQKYRLIDFDLGVKITGAGFPVYLGKGAKLQRALIQFFLDRGLRRPVISKCSLLRGKRGVGLRHVQLPTRKDRCTS